MQNQEKAQTSETAKNYTDEMVSEIKAQEPVDLAKAKMLAEKLGKSYQSIISKCLAEGIEYESKKPEPKRVNKEKTKAEMVAEISEKLDNANLAGLEKANAVSLKRLFDALPV